MLYSNTLLKLTGENVYTDALGILKLTPMPGDDSIPVVTGYRRDLSLISRQGELLLGRVTDPNLYVVLSSHKDNPQFGYGSVKALKGQKNKVVFSKIVMPHKTSLASLDFFVIKAKPGDVFRVTWSGYLSGAFEHPFSFYFVKEKEVLSFTLSELKRYLGESEGAIPFSFDENGTIIPSEWESISVR